MSDPFELRLFFSNRLRALNPCEDNTEEVVAFALKHRELDEDLWSCVLEQMERDENSINVRANITYFLEDLVELAKREKHSSYVRMVERDFMKIIDAAIPLDGMGIVNVNCVRYVLQVLHHDHGVFCTEQNRTEHNKAFGQNWETKTFRELEEYLDKRAKEARPDTIEADEDDESEPDMSWVNQPPNAAAEAGSKQEIDDNRPPDEVVLQTSPGAKVVDLLMPDLHDVPSPPGSRSPSLVLTPARTPVPPTPPSPSASPQHELTQTNPPSSTKQNGTHSPSTSPPATKVFSPANPPSAGTSKLLPPPIQVPHTPSAFTPVQKEDSNIFTQSYFELATERMEQDRERQRRKEDSSGFVALASSVDEEVAQILAVPTKGDVWMEDLIAERGVWGLMGE